ncbi:MAG: Holliday junction resolvase RuvX [Luteibaculaceae bacterium]
MGKIVALDLGKKRTGIAETDSAQIIASPKEMVETKELKNYLTKWLAKEKLDAFVIGLPVHLDGNESEMSLFAKEFGKWITDNLKLPVHFWDERFTSSMALDAMIAMGSKKKDRMVKGNIDKISAAIILQEFLNQKSK